MKKRDVESMSLPELVAASTEEGNKRNREMVKKEIVRRQSIASDL
jgi:hypothetical protein